MVPRVKSICLALLIIFLIPASATARPNVLFILTDDQTREQMDYLPKTKQMFENKGTFFSNFYATLPLCCPSRATFFTGEYAHNHGVLSNDPPDGGYKAYRREGHEKKNLATILEDRGYNSALVGKYLNGYAKAKSLKPPRGWDSWYVPGKDIYSMYNYSLNQNGDWKKYGHKKSDYKTDVYSKIGQDLIKKYAHDKKPFFLEISSLAPHFEREGSPRRDPRPARRHLGDYEGTPLPKPPSYSNENNNFSEAALANYWVSAIESLKSVDEMVKDLVATLRKTGELKKTIIVFASDNGFQFGEHGGMGKSAPYEESVRVPFYIRGPGFPEGAKRDQITGNIDFAPTILKAAGAKIPASVDGKPLQEFANNPLAGLSRDILIERPPCSSVVCHRPFVGVRSGSFVYFKWDNNEHLYNLATDPYQVTNLATNPLYMLSLLPSLRSRAEELSHCQGESCS